MDKPFNFMDRKQTVYRLVVVLLLAVVLFAMQRHFSSPPAAAPGLTPSAAARETHPPTAPVPSPSPTLTFTPTPTVSPTPLPYPIGPDSYPAGVNPLTGLTVADPASLDLPPALVSISNSPITARPQSGLSYSPLVFEMYIGEGVTRFLAMFYGDLPPEEMNGETLRVGPIRSGRVPYEDLRLFYRGFLVFASASSRVLPQLDEFSIIYGTDKTSPNTARISVADLKSMAEENRKTLGSPGFSGRVFDPAPPAAGKLAHTLWVGYHQTEQVLWRYQSDSGAYQRIQDQEDGVTYLPSIDQLTGKPLEFENVVVLFADTVFYDKTLFDINFQYITRYPALLLRDGVMQEIYWTTRNEEYEQRTGKLRGIRFVDYEFNPIPLKPGKTWVEIVPLFTPYDETVDNEIYKDYLTVRQPGSGVWGVYFLPPQILNTTPDWLLTPAPK